MHPSSIRIGCSNRSERQVKAPRITSSCIVNVFGTIEFIESSGINRLIDVFPKLQDSNAINGLDFLRVFDFGWSFDRFLSKDRRRCKDFVLEFSADEGVGLIRINKSRNILHRIEEGSKAVIGVD